MVDLGTLGDSLSSATGVSGDIVVGESDTATGDSRAFAYDLSTGGPMVDLGTLGGCDRPSVAEGVDGGIVVGSSCAGTDPSSWSRPFAYDLAAGGPMVDLGTLPGFDVWSAPADVEGNRVVGTAAAELGIGTGFSNARAVVWTLVAEPAGDPPFGHLDGARSPASGQVRVFGWAADADRPEGPLQGQVTVDGVLAGEITADKTRADVAAAFPGYGENLGFDSTLSVTATGTVDVCATAVNEGPGSTNAGLGCQSVDVRAGDPPFGHLDGVGSPASGQVRVFGWAADPDLPEGPLQVQVTVDGVLAGEITADKTRADVAAAFPGYGENLGFDSTLSVTATGTVTVCAAAVNEGPGSTNAGLGCQSVDVTDQP